MNKILLGIVLLTIILAGCQTTRSYRPASPIPVEFIRAQGNGKAPKETISPEQAQLLAREMAKTDAINHLRDKIMTIPVRGGLTVEECISRNPALQPKIENVIQSARIISEHQEKESFWVEINIRYSDLKSACR